MQENRGTLDNAGMLSAVCDTQRNHHRLDNARSKQEGRYCKLRFATLNVGTLTGEEREVSVVMATRKIEILRLQETRWTGGSSGGEARILGDGCKSNTSREEVRQD